MASTWITKAAKGGCMEGQYNLGVLFHKGEGMPKDEKQSLAWFEKAADSGYPDAQFSIGLLYEKGKDMPKNEAVAQAWFKKAADQGNKKAREKLASVEHKPATAVSAK
jgi:TPR repeat protein